MEFRDYYATLGVARQASADEIRKAFRRLARKYHPDVSKEADAAARMQEINEAWAVLGDPERRAAYDRLDRSRQAGGDFYAGFGAASGRDHGMHEPSGPAGRGFSAADAAAFSDFFASLFGDDLRPRARHRRDAAADQHARIELDLEDAWRGCSREIELQLPRFTADGQVSVETRRLVVRIPPGVGDGQRIRLAGQGLPGESGHSGDLLLEVRLRPHPRFRVVGRDLHLSLPIAPWEAALGGIVGVELPDRSRVRVRIPAGAQSGRQLRVRGHGLPGQPAAAAHAAGDLLLDLRIVLPPADTPRARELYAAMARELAFDPRAAGD